MIQKTTNLEYFATLEEHDQLAEAMVDKIVAWRKYCASRGLTDIWVKKVNNYYGNAISGNSSQAVTRGGSEGELSMIKVNDLRSLIQEQLVIVTAQRPAGVAKAINSDPDSLKSARIGTAICEYYMSQSDFESKFVTCTEAALLCDEGFTELYWDKSAGDPIAVDPDTNQPVMSGDCVLKVHMPWNMARDVGVVIQNNTWYIISSKMNRFDACARYPKFKDYILTCGDEDLPELPMNHIPDESDQIYVHRLVHDRTAALPEGRYSLMIGEKIVEDMPLPYKDFPIERMTPADVLDGNIGYANSNDILAMEEMTDALHSVICTNQVTFGGQCLITAEGSNIKHTDLAKGVRLFEVPKDMVDAFKALDLVHTPVEIFNYIGLLGEKKGKAVGSVSGILAQQAQQGASGNSMALIQTQAIQYNSGTQRSYFKLLSGTMTKLIGVLRVYADTPRVAAIVGKSKAQGLKAFKFTGHDLGSISSIVYEVVNPMFQTYGGRLTAAQDLLKAGQVKSPKQYINLVATGQPDVLDQDDEADGFLILEENEALREGRPVKAVITEMHADHIKSHDSLITQEAKENDPQLVERVTAHVLEHIQLWSMASQTNPAILIATNQQPLPPPQPMMMGGPPPQPGPPPPLGPMESSAPAIEQKGNGVSQPNLPNIAGTDQKPTIPGVTDQMMM